MNREYDIVEYTKDISTIAGVQRCIAGFVDQWIGPTASEDGYSINEIRLAEDRLHARIPEILKFVYRAYGRREDIIRNQDELLALDQLKVDPKESMLVYRVEQQACAQWGFSLNAASDDLSDPPVFVKSEISEEGSLWKSFLDRLSLAALEMFLSESLFSERLFSCNRPQIDSDLDGVSEALTRIPLPSYPMWADQRMEVSWYAGRDQLVRLDGTDWLWACGRTEEALHKLRELIPGDWLDE
jgi:hypothetical protein